MRTPRIAESGRRRRSRLGAAWGAVTGLTEEAGTWCGEVVGDACVTGVDDGVTDGEAVTDAGGRSVRAHSGQPR